MLKKNAGEIAEICRGKLEGDPEIKAHGISTLREAGEGEIAVLKDDKFLSEAAASGASIMIAAEPVEGFKGAHILVDDPEAAMAEVLGVFRAHQFSPPEGLSERASVSTQASLAEDVSVGPFSVIESGASIGKGSTIFPHVYIGHDVLIGEETIIYPHVTIMGPAKIGDGCIIRAGATIGEEGFGFIQREGGHRRLHHLGGVVIGDYVEVGSHSSIDRGMLEDTVVGDGCKIDKHCMIAHNCRIGKNCLLAGYSRMAGSVSIGDGAILAADVRVSDHKHIGENAVMAAGTGVTRDIKPGEVVWGVPTRPIRTQTRLHALEGRLPDLFKRVRKLEKKLEGDR